LFWTALLAHIYLTFAQPLPDDDRIREFAERYRITSSLEVLAIAATGIIFSLFVLFRRARWAAIALMWLAGFVLWRWYLSGLSYLFRPPLGDGTVGRAASTWWRLYSPLLGWHILKVTMLLLSIIIWPFIYARLSRDRRGHAAVA
jgi:hypothetical protein